MESNYSNINYFNNVSEYWSPNLDIISISTDTINKKTLVDYKQWQNKSSSEGIFLKWIEFNLYDKGLAIISFRISI